MKMITGTNFKEVAVATLRWIKTSKPYLAYYSTWFLMNVTVGLFPIISDFLDGKSASQIYPSLLLVFVVMLASGTHMYFKMKKLDINARATLFFSIAIVWIMLLILLSTKFPYKHPVLHSLLLGDNLIVFMVALSFISTIIGGFIYFPYIELDVKSSIAGDKLKCSETAVKNQTLDEFDKGDL